MPDPAPQIDHVGAAGVDVLVRQSGLSPSTRVAGMMSFIRFSVRRNVLLPQPEGPMNADTWFSCSPTEMSWRTRVSP